MKLKLWGDVLHDKPKPMTDYQLMDELVLPMMNFSNKLVLAGSLSLKILGLMDKNRLTHDLDFVLTEKLTQDELNHIRDFFEFTISNTIINDAYQEVTITLPQTEREIIHLKSDRTSVDIFNNNYVKEGDIIYVLHNKNLIKVNHPSQTILAKCKYMLNIVSHSFNKHKTDVGQMIWEGTGSYYNLAQVLKHTNNQYISRL
jgi:hypothetical protein